MIWSNYMPYTSFCNYICKFQVRSVRASELHHTNSACCQGSKADGKGAPIWTAYDNSIVCECCQCPFTWHSTFRGEAQEYRERYNCRQCGGLVCGPCSLERRAIPHLGLIQPSRVCDKCFHKVVKQCTDMPYFCLIWDPCIILRKISQ